MRANGSNILAPGLPSFPLHHRSPGDWDVGKLYPVTAAQLLPVFTEFLDTICFNPKSEVDRGDLTQSAGRECHSSGFAVSFDTPQPSLCHLGSASCAISSPPTSEFGFNLVSQRTGVTFGQAQAESIKFLGKIFFGFLARNPSKFGFRVKVLRVRRFARPPPSSRPCARRLFTLAKGAGHAASNAELPARQSPARPVRSHWVRARH